MRAGKVEEGWGNVLASDAVENDVESETKKVQIWQKEIQGLLIEMWCAGVPQVQGRVHKV